MTKYVSITAAAYLNVNLKAWLIGSLIATLGYGVVLTLVFSYLHAFIKLFTQPLAPQELGLRRRGCRYLFLSYTMFMFGLSTLAFICGVLGVVNALFPSPQGLSFTQNAFFLFGVSTSMVLASWTADALMIWRCLILYKTISKLKRAILILILIILSLLSIAAGLAYVVTSLTLLNDAMIAFVIAADILNSTLTILIVSRIWYHQKYVKSSLGPVHRLTYTRLTHLFVESAAIVALFGAAHVGLVRWPNHALIISHQLLVHVYVIAALTIVYRLAFGEERNSSDSLTITLESEMKFTDPILSRVDSWSTSPSSARDEETAVRVPNRLK
ncbi:hypothetical protein CPB83DRAFT_904446 [Crepidotus variabilis]|uniref:Uncharacterized protein n=1 Tax=Crepidotus variabilis TaxID=179855 RepID=A0A9P6EM05_9AGAR|nr:hypothetical protein CPB83DRAFT_904446 [Crepidotus variabilis]